MERREVTDLKAQSVSQGPLERKVSPVYRFPFFLPMVIDLTWSRFLINLIALMSLIEDIMKFMQ